MVDYSALLYDPVYGILGVPATILGGTSVFQNNIFQQNIFQGGKLPITVIDNTRGKTSTSGPLETRSVDPSAFARIPELTSKNIPRSKYQGNVLTFNGRTWTVRSYELRGSPNGEDQGEVQFFLKD